MGGQGRRSTAASAAVQHDRGTDIPAEHASGPSARAPSTAEELLVLKGSVRRQRRRCVGNDRPRQTRPNGKSQIKGPLYILVSLCTAPRLATQFPAVFTWGLVSHHHRSAP